ncbi:MAG: carboxypeptidase regulatory-like domain-containing protein [Acidobacteriota bacterium]|nr:carboxypeptidase regulatory-like domain-containing protein [Acidobacteriota bacterium]
MTKKTFMHLMLGAILTGIFSLSVTAQVTTSEMVGRVTDAQEKPLPGVTVEAVHVPSGTNYTAVTNEAGRFTIPGMRVGGPYTVKAIQAGFREQVVNDLQLSLGTAATVNFTLSSAITETVNVEVGDTAIFSESRTGAATAIGTQQIEALPTISRRISDFTRLSPHAGGGGTFAGQDNRLNNITVDGSYFNNSFGLGGQPGDRTQVSPISLDAIEAIQVNVSPYDVRQGNFVGAGVNTVTRSGTNTYSGSVYYLFRKPSLVGKKAGENSFNPGEFDYKNWGFRLGGPLPFFNFGEGGPLFTSGKNKLFFFASYENEELTEPGTNFTARSAGQTPGGTVTRVLASDLDNLSSFLAQKFGYETGPYQGYSHATPARKFLFRTDYNINSTNRLSVRYIHLDSSTDVPVSNSSSLGFGNRRGGSPTTTGLNFQNSNYQILENIRSIVGEWNSAIGNEASNNLIIGYTKQDESRTSRGTFFPFVDILEGGSTYTSFGFEPFTPNNELRYNSFQIQDNLTFYRGSHTIATGVSLERYESENVFFPGSQSVYTYNSLADFLADANGYLANPNRTTSPVNLRRFQVRWSNIPGLEKPIQPLEVLYAGVYGQDTWRVRENFTLNFGLRVDVPFFGETGFVNPQANALTFRDETGQSVQYRTEKLPDASLLWSPRVGFNWNPFSSDRVQVRGGTGVFTGRPAYVWISNQIGGNGILTGFEQLDNTTIRPFNPNPDRYKPTNVTGAPAGSYELALTDPNFKFPQIWRSTIGTDVRLPLGLVGGTEFLYTRDVNGVYYINANLANPNTAFTGPDNRPRWTTSNRINSNITSAVVLKNQNLGRMWNLAFTLEKPYSNGLWFKGGYSYGEAKNTVDPGSIAFGSWNNNQHAGNPNNPGLGYSSASMGHRFFGAASYRLEYFKFGATSFSSFWETRTGANGSYVFSGDLNGDGGTSNDLIYIPRDVSEMNFSNITTATGTVLFTPAQQAAAWDAFISQDPYLSKNRGKYAERGAAFLPFFTNVDFSVAQDIIATLGKTRHTFQVRADILNFGNLLNSNWGVGQAFNTLQPLVTTSTSSTATCRNPSPTSTAASYCLQRIGGNLLPPQTFIDTAGTRDVYRIQIGIRYIFN